MTKLLTFQELRVVLGGRGRTTVYRDVENGRLPPPIKLGGRVYWLEEQIEASLRGLEPNKNEWQPKTATRQ